MHDLDDAVEMAIKRRSSQGLTPGELRKHLPSPQALEESIDRLVKQSKIYNRLARKRDNEPVYVADYRMKQADRLVALDTETHLIKPGCAAPKLVCVSADAGNGPSLFNAADGIALFEECLRDPHTHITGHHFFFDLAVFAMEKPDLLGLIFDAVDQGRVHCTRIREMILANAAGELKFVENELGELKAAKFGLADILYRRFKISLDKSSDTWRMRYHLLDGKPLDEWPSEARDYALKDAEYAYMLFMAQEGDSLPEGVLGEHSQTQAAWALYLMGAWGIRTDPEAVSRFRENVSREYAEQEDICRQQGFVRDNGTMNTKAVKQAIKAWFIQEGLNVPTTDAGNIKTNRDTLAQVGISLRAVSERSRLRKLKTTYLPILEDGVKYPINPNYNPIIETFRTSCRNPNCFDGETEVLTKSGWIRFDELDPERPVDVAQWRDGVIEFVAWTHYHKYSSDKPLMRFTNQHIDLCVTANHRCLLQHRKTHALQMFEAKDYPEDWRQLHGGVYAGGPGLDLTNDELMLACATQADGHYHDGGICFSFAKKRKIDRFQEILERVSAPYSRWLKKPREGYQQETRFRIKKSTLVDKIYELLGPEKRLGPWILRLSREQLDLFCSEIWHWDGCLSRQSMYSSSDRVNADWVQTALTLSAQRAKRRTYMPPSGRPNYQVDVTRRNYSLTTNISRSSENQCTVYCVSVPSSFLLVRRNGRTAITGNCQNPPRKGGFRGCFVPRPGWLYVFCDYSTLEMRTLAQICLDLFGFSYMADALRQGKDLHLMVAAQILDISYNEALKRQLQGDDEVRVARAAAKPANFGFPGGMGPRSFVEYAWNSYGVRVDYKNAQTLKATFLQMWPEMDKYFQYCSGQMDIAKKEATVVFARSGLMRGKVRYTAVCNGYFQHLAAMGAKEALYHVSRECYLNETEDLAGCRPVFFIHDEIGLEVPYAHDYAKATRAARRLSYLMESTMRKWVPDIETPAEPALMRRWYKGAEPVERDGMLVPCRPVKQGGKTLWVED